MTKALNAWFEVSWRGNAIDLILMDWEDGCCTRYWVVAETKEVAEGFFSAVCGWKPELEGEVLVFEGGCWARSEALFEAIRGATFENLILDGTLKQDLRDDLTGFFAARDAYDAHGVPWKRGLLLIGPPGNGKTHAVKALVNAVGRPCLYVKSFTCEDRVDSTNIRIVFDKARKMAPCILVLEDLDSLLTDENRSFFLNELDGFAANRGIATLATTNHPDKLDPAIVDRPSRFDRKYHFPLPAVAERLAYIARWEESMRPALRLSEAGRTRVAEQTEGFSFAYLKELSLAGMMAWMASPRAGAMDEVMAVQVTALRNQMSSARAPGRDDDTRST
jgi:ATP-dependent Zn protease